MGSLLFTIATIVSVGIIMLVVFTDTGLWADALLLFSLGLFWSCFPRIGWFVILIIAITGLVSVTPYLE
jgi:hypothetical protein